MAPEMHLRFAFILLLVLTTSRPCELKLQDVSSQCENPSEVYRVLLSNNGPTTFGGSTTFYARVERRKHFETPRHISSYKFCWKWALISPQCHNTSSNEDNFEWDKWKYPGEKFLKIIAYVRSELESTGVDVCVINTTTASVTDTINARLTASQDHSAQAEIQLNVGLVNLNVIVHDPSQLLENISCWWQFGDGTWLNNTMMKQVFHNYTQDKRYNLSIKLVAWGNGTLGKRKYNGSARLALEFRANLTPKLVIYGRPGPKLPNPREGVVVLAVGVARFVMEFSDPYHLVRQIHTDWVFHMHGEKPHRFKSNVSITYNFTSQSSYTLWATTEVWTQYKKQSFVKYRNLLIQEPIKDLDIQYSQHGEQMIIFNVSCQGSGPISFCWFISKSCHDLPVNKTCSLTLERRACGIVINHTFIDPGNYCINLTAENEVSSANTHARVKIPNDNTPTTAASKAESASVVLPIVLCIIAMVVLAMLVRKWMSYKKRPVERADFDFRDEDSRSFSSVDLSMSRACFPCKVFRKCPRGEGDYLLSNFGTERYKPSDLYNELL